MRLPWKIEGVALTARKKSVQFVRYVECKGIYFGEQAMSNIQVTEIRDNFSEIVNRSAFGNERTIIERHGKPVAAVVSIEDVNFLLELEAKFDLDEARAALKEAAEDGVADWDSFKGALTG